MIKRGFGLRDGKHLVLYDEWPDKFRTPPRGYAFPLRERQLALPYFRAVRGLRDGDRVTIEGRVLRVLRTEVMAREGRLWLTVLTGPWPERP